MVSTSPTSSLELCWLFLFALTFDLCAHAARLFLYPSAKSIFIKQKCKHETSAINTHLVYNESQA